MTTTEVPSDFGTVEDMEPWVDRPLGDLLKLTTYQGMTDTEIDTLIDYKIHMAILDDDRQRTIEIEQQNSQIMREQNAALCQATENMLESMLGLVLEFDPVKQSTVQPTALEL